MTSSKSPRTILVPVDDTNVSRVRFADFADQDFLQPRILFSLFKQGDKFIGLAVTCDAKQLLFHKDFEQDIP